MLWVCDEDIPTITPSPIDTDELPVAAKKKSNNEIRIGPITRARASGISNCILPIRGHRLHAQERGVVNILQGLRAIALASGIERESSSD